MRKLLRRRAAVAVLLLAAALTLPASSGAAPASPAHAAKLKRCKSGANAKKCRCPKGQKLVKSHRKYRCKKKKAPPQQGDQTQGDNTNTDPGTGTNADPGTGTNTDPGTGTGSPPAQTGNGAQTERDDAGYRAALSAASRFGPRTDESNSGGIYTYTYDLCSGGQFNLRSEYYNSVFGQTLDTNYGGTWELEQGYKVIQSANGAGWAGILIIRESDGTTSRIEVDFNDQAGQFVVGNAAHLAGGVFSRAASAC
jgi:hypothetical protein